MLLTNMITSTSKFSKVFDIQFKLVMSKTVITNFRSSPIWYQVLIFPFSFIAKLLRSSQSLHVEFVSMSKTKFGPVLVFTYQFTPVYLQSQVTIACAKSGVWSKRPLHAETARPWPRSPPSVKVIRPDN